MLFYLSIVLAGGLGALLRYLLGRATINVGLTALPFGTLLANTLGCFLMGYLSWAMIEKWQLSKEAQVIVLTGFLGGFTTFSAFSLEVLAMLEQGSGLRAAIYLSIKVILCILMCMLGLYVARQT